MAAKVDALHRALDALVEARVAEGASRRSPFAALLLRSRTDIKRMRPLHAAKTIRLLVRRVRRTLPGARVKAACARAEKAASAVLASIEERERATSKRR